VGETNIKQIIIGVITCPKYEYKVKGIQDTWLKTVPPNVRVIFVYGRPGRMASIEGDRLFLDCPEAYEKLPQKMHCFFQYCVQNFDFDYLLKIDDDSYVDIGKLLAFNLRDRDYIGLFRGMGDERVTRTWHYGKCTDKSFEVPYEGKYIADWARGGGYILSRKAVEKLALKTAESHKEHIFEDKMVGDALASEGTITKAHADYVAFGVLNPMRPQNMRYVHNLALALNRALSTTTSSGQKLI
jgi:hypothetical protein